MIIHENFPLKPFNTFGIDAIAKKFSSFGNKEELAAIIDGNRESLLILGGGSNVLFTKNFDGLVLKNEIKGIEVLCEDENDVYVKVGAGEVWHEFVKFCIQNNFSGVENLALIPGSVGASPMQNIGAYGVEIKSVFHSLEAFHLKDHSVLIFTNEDCKFGYRESVFKNKYKGEFAILSVTYRLAKQPRFNTSYGAIEEELQRMGVKDLSIQAIAQAVINIRTSKLPNPAEIGNAGSFFKNPEIAAAQFELLKNEYPSMPGYPLEGQKVKLAAGWLIEQCGWKGYRKGHAGCHAKQALVLVNYGGVKGNEILELSEEIIQSVKKKFNVQLEREVNII